MIWLHTILAAFLLGALAASAQEADFVVAPGGDDAAAGTAQAPFATVARAQEAVRSLRAAQPERATPVLVHLRGGTYIITEPVAFGPDDSGTAQSPTVYAAYPGETPVISGGVVIDEWRVEGGRWVTTLPEVAEGDRHFRQLWVNGQRRLRPRVPAEGYLHIEGAVPPTGDPEAPGHDRFRFARGDLRADWHNRADVELLIFHPWSMSRLPIADVDEERRIVTLRSRTWHSGIAALNPRKRYIVENVREALDAPGQWYLDRNTGELTYIPLEGETPDNTQVIAPRARQLVTFTGDPEIGLPAGHIELRGLTFEHTLATVPDEGYCVAQAEVGRRGTTGRSPLLSAIEATGARNVALVGCTVRHVGAYAVEFGVSCHDNAVRDCELYDLGGGGVRAGANDLYPEGDERNATGLTVEDCLIAHGGRLHPAAVGVYIGHSGQNRVVYNDIHDFYYTGISVGWNWGWGYSPAKENLIAHNHIYDIGQERLADLGGIYTLGASEGTVLSHNRIHDVTRVEYGGSGIYFDQSTVGITVENNLTFRTRDAGFTVHYARDNAIHNNIFAYGEEFTIGPGRTDISGPMTFERNIVAWRTGTAYRSLNVRDDFAADSNLYWREDGSTEDFAGDRSFEQWQERGKDANSLVADPGFLDPDNGDFRLRADSPALQIGFVPWDLDDVGRRTALRRLADAPAVPHTFPRVGPPTPVAVDEDFALYESGDKPSALRLYENNETEVIRVSDETAVSGGRSLKFTDGPSEPSWNPHCFWDPGFSDGVLVGSFDLLLRPGAVLTHEWRDTDTGSGFRVGPSLRITGEGRLLVGNRELLVLPHDRWVNLEMTSGVGPDTTGEWTLVVRGHDGPEHRFEGLACSPTFRALRWLGFVAAGTEPAEMYVDNVRLRPAEE